MRSFLPFLKAFIKKHSLRLSKLLGLTLLNKQQTEVYLTSLAEQLLHDRGDRLTLPSVMSATGKNKQLFPAQAILTASRYVWRLQNKDNSLVLLPNGSLRVHGNVLDLGFGNGIVLQDALKRTRRQQQQAKILLAPWPHYWTGYFDYIFFIALNIYRIKQTLSPEEFAEAVVCYPLFHSSFEREILALLGFETACIFDSRRVDIRFDTCLIGNNDNWFYPNKQDVLAFRSLLTSQLTYQPAANTRLYIQRTGRRKVLNESALLDLLRQYDFTIVPDEPRSFADQILIYHNASFIMGPHGASFANVLSCRPGTHLFELFPNTYMPEYFRYLAHILDLPYSAYCAGQPSGSEHSHVEDDVVVNLADLEEQLRHLLPQAVLA